MKRCKCMLAPFLYGMVCGAVSVLLLMVSFKYVLLFACIGALVWLLRKRI
ncbi:hypothetical protein H6A12_02320 [Phocea massiliensis]|uniref:Uncharacterized protein n=1 Tax=Merdimmobilis hominis TaxID=2897707 RepID=A0A938X4E2_9FIRM|nr:hypothetical protein [Merdimmobilis hominis]MBM6919996.1 hypothetical protein [Merdimmobilis hominis]